MLISNNINRKIETSKNKNNKLSLNDFEAYTYNIPI